MYHSFANKPLGETWDQWWIIEIIICKALCKFMGIPYHNIIDIPPSYPQQLLRSPLEALCHFPRPLAPMLLSSSPTGTARSQSPSHKVFSDDVAPLGAVKVQGWHQRHAKAKTQTPRQRWGMVGQEVAQKKTKILLNEPMYWFKVWHVTAKNGWNCRVFFNDPPDSEMLRPMTLFRFEAWITNGWLGAHCLQVWYCVVLLAHLDSLRPNTGYISIYFPGSGHFMCIN